MSDEAFWHKPRDSSRAREKVHPGSRKGHGSVYFLRHMHRFIPDPSAETAKPTPDAGQLAAVKDIVRGLLSLPKDTPVTIHEIPCADPGCPLMETVIGVFPDGRGAMRWRLTRPRAALTRLMLAQTLAMPAEMDGRDRLDPPAKLGS
jgi:hypothetical protein